MAAAIDGLGLFLVNGRQGASRVLDTVISEHFGKQNVESSDHLERFFLAKGIGLIRWERWQNWADKEQTFLVRLKNWLFRADAGQSMAPFLLRLAGAWLTAEPGQTSSGR